MRKSEGRQRLGDNMGDEKQVLVTEKTYEVDKADFLVIQGFDQSKTWYNKTAGFMDTLRLIPRLLMIAMVMYFGCQHNGSWDYLIQPTHRQRLYRPS